MDVPPERQFIGFEAYKQAIPLADVVILATPPGFRPMQFEEAVKQGKHVFTEKPVATDAPGIRALPGRCRRVQAEEPESGRGPAAAPPGRLHRNHQAPA